MAAIFQIRRGSGSVSLVDGELYLHKSSGSIQFSLGDGNPILLARLDQINSGSLNLSGDVTASNAVFTGDVAISGNLYLGNQITDNISALGQFTTNLVPNPNNSIDVGTPTAVWRTMYATTFSGSFDGTINGLGNPAVFSASVDNRLDQLETFSGSQEAKDITISAYTASMNTFTQSVNEHIADINIKTGSFENKFTTLQTYTASVDVHISNVNSFTSSQEAKNVVIGAYTASMNTFTQSINEHTASINSFSSSQEAKDVVIGEYTSSMNSFTSSTNVRLNEIELYTSSLKSAIDVTGGNTRILGNLIVDGTQTSLNTTETFVEDKSITLASGSTTSAIADGAGLNIAGANVSMSWEDGNQRLYFNTNLGIEGSISSSTVVGLNGASVEVYSTSVDSRLTNLESKSASVDNSISLLNQFTQSQDNKNSTLATYTASVDSDLASIHITTSSLNQFTQSQDNKNSTLATYTASVDSSLASIYITTASLNEFTASIAGTNDFTASTKIRLDNLESTSASFSSSIEQLNLKTGSFETKFTTIQSVTSSLNNFTSSQESKNTTLENVTASLNLATASFNSWTGSGFFTAYSTSVDNLLDGLRYDVDLLTPAGLNAAFDSLNAFTTSANSRLSNLESTTASLNSAVSNINSFTTSANSRLSNLESTTASLNSAISNINSFTASNNIAELNLYTSSLKGAITVSGTDVSLAGNLTVLGTTTIIDSTTVNIKDNIIQLNGAGSANAGLVVRDATGTLTSGSLLWDTTNDYWIAGPLGAESKLLRAGGDNVVSSSSQINLLLPAGVVSGSSQITYANISSIPAGIVSGSSQVSYTGLSNIPSGIVSGSSQILGVTNAQLINSNITVAGTSVALGGTVTADQIRTAIGTVVTGSSQITLSSTTGGGTTANVQFGSLGIGITPTNVSGEIVASGDIVAFFSSDIRLKENIQPIQNALEKVESISGNTYDWKEGFEELHSHKGNDVGVIAQEIEEILPQIVTNRDNGFKAVQYEKIVPLLIEAIKELSAKVKQLENK